MSGTATDTDVKIGAGLSGHLDSMTAAEQVCAQCGAALSGRDVDLAMLFISTHHVPMAERIAETVRRTLGVGCLVGLSASCVLGGEAELEDAPGVSLLGASLPGVKVRPFRTEWLPAVGEGSDQEHAALAQAAGMVGDLRATFLFADPFSVPMNALLPALSEARRFADGPAAGSAGAEQLPDRAPILGGMASGGERPDSNVLILNDSVTRSGGVGVSLANVGDGFAGGVRIDSVVSQGCRPIGPPFVVTACRKQILQGLGGRSALDALAQVLRDLDEHDRDLLKSRGLFLGRAVDEYKERFGRGDFLIRNVIGVDKRHEAIAVAELLRVGQTVQFHVRDETTADEDLALLLDGQKIHEPPAGALLFTCHGRGRRLFDTPHHDARAVSRAFAGEAPWGGGEVQAKSGTPIPASPRPLPLAGFFAAGEIGPIGDGVFVHGHTACVGLIRSLR